MRSVWSLLVGLLSGLLLMGIFGLSFLTGPSVEPVSAYCRGFTEGFSYAFQMNAPQGAIDQSQTDVNESACMSDRMFAAEGWLWKGPLLP
jgi:hypothetical protein